MFSSAKKAQKPTALQRPSTNRYSSFQEPSTSNGQDGSRKRAHDEMSSESSGPEVTDDLIVDFVRLQKDKKKKKKHKKHKKDEKKKKRRRNSSSSDVEVIPTDDFFIIDRSKTLNNYNYKFERKIKKHPVKLNTKLPITISRDSHALMVLTYGSKERFDYRYYNSTSKDQMLKQPTERIFRRLSNDSLFIDKELIASGKPYDPDEGDIETINYENRQETFDTDVGLKERKFENFSQLDSEQRIKRIKQSIDFESENVDNWLKFLTHEDADFKCVARLTKNANRNAFLERRLEIIRQGRKKVRAKDSLPLDLEFVKTLMELYQVTDNERVNTEMNTLLRNRIYSFDVWTMYIKQFCHNTNFSLVDTLQSFDLAIERLSGLFNRTIVSHKPLPNTDNFLTDLVVNRALLLMESGSVYSVVAILQAAAEFFFFMPDKLKSKSWAEQLNQFENFYTSGIQRLGDENANGWKNFELASMDIDAITQQELAIEADLTELVETLESETIKMLTELDATNRLNAWSELEQNRSKCYWRPLKPITELLKMQPNEWNKRLVVFNIVKSSLLPLDSSKLKLELLLRLLQCLGAKTPGFDDMSQFGQLHAILPNDFNFVTSYVGLFEFLVEFMFQLCTSADIVGVEQILVSIVATTVHFLDLKHDVLAQKIDALDILQRRILGLNLSQQANYCAMLQIYDAILEYSNLQKSLSGSNLVEVFDDQYATKVEKKSLEALLMTLTQISPWEANDVNQQQILLRSAYFIAIYIPSIRTGATKHRLRFLTLLVIKELDKFLDESFDLTAEVIESARGLWSKLIWKMLDQADENLYSFIESPSELTIMLCSLFEFEYANNCSFITSSILNETETSNFIERSSVLTKFRLDLSYEMWQNRVCQWSDYTKWTLKAVEKYDVPGLYSHLANVYGAKPCRFRLFVEWKNMDPKLKSKRAFAMFASEYLIFKRACEADDLLLVDQSYKRIRQILEEAAPLLSESPSPDSFIWRLWHYIERTKKNRVEMEQVYLLGVRSCPFSKQFLIDVTLSPFTPMNRLEEINRLANNFSLPIFTLPEESSALHEAALKMKQ